MGVRLGRLRRAEKVAQTCGQRVRWMCGREDQACGRGEVSLLHGRLRRWMAVGSQQGRGQVPE